TVLIRSLPFGEAERLVYMWTPMPRYPMRPREQGPSVPEVLAWRSSSRSFSSITGFQQRMLTWNTGSDSIRLSAAVVLGNFFETLRGVPILGRTLNADDDRPAHERVAVISYAFWTSQFGHNPGALGKTIQLGGRPCRIVGVMPPNFLYPH